ncbi:hypothetical protein ILYODFUR_037454 [Ilyodon furcidens]|uniref:Uncharacterized protein n=1 Tax=Ilyodon furcidens TaxID=33524 RepID=A0ABV0TRC1_9TELE
MLVWSSIDYESFDLVVSDRFPAFKLFREWPCGAKVHLRALPVQICASVASSRETRGKWQQNFFFSGGCIIPVTSELRCLLSCACQTVQPKWMTPTSKITVVAVP